MVNTASIVLLPEKSGRVRYCCTKPVSMYTKMRERLNAVRDNMGRFVWTRKCTLHKDVASRHGGRVSSALLGTEITPSGYIKSRHLDDKSECGYLAQFLHRIADENLMLPYTTCFFFSNNGNRLRRQLRICHRTMEYLAVDMGAMGDDPCRLTGIPCPSAWRTDRAAYRWTSSAIGQLLRIRGHSLQVGYLSFLRWCLCSHESGLGCCQRDRTGNRCKPCLRADRKSLDACWELVGSGICRSMIEN